MNTNQLAEQILSRLRPEIERLLEQSAAEDVETLSIAEAARQFGVVAKTMRKYALDPDSGLHAISIGGVADLRINKAQFLRWAKGKRETAGNLAEKSGVAEND